MDKFSAVINALNAIDSKYIRCKNMDDIAEDCGVEYASGASRWCFYCDEWDFVIKFPRFTSTDRDYCAMEAFNYESAKAYGITPLLLRTEHIHTTRAGLKIYRQPKYSVAFADLYGAEYDALERRLHGLHNTEIVAKCINSCYQGYRISPVWLARVLQVYGKKFVRAFEAWTNENSINDLHYGNVGFKDGKPIILDYAGFYG